MLALIVFGAAVLTSAVAHAAIVASVVRRAAAAAPDTTVPRPRLVMELVWALIPALALALVFTATWSRVRDRAMPAPSAIVKIAQ